MAIFDIGNHLSSKWKKTDYYSNFVYAGNPIAPVEFEYVFKFGDDLLEYQYSKNSDGLLVAESLVVNHKLVFKKDAAFFEIDNEQFKMICIRYGESPQRAQQGK